MTLNKMTFNADCCHFKCHILVSTLNVIILNAIVLNAMAPVLSSILNKTSRKIIYKIDLSSGLYG
jgi:hypothetical protein